MVGAGAGLHGDDAARGQRSASGNELVARQGAANEHALGAVDGVNLNDALGQIDTHAHGFTAHSTSCNLLHGLPLSMA